jgi:putative flippase GtrA
LAAVRASRQFLTFAAVGAAGFVVDVGTLWLAMTAGAGPLGGRGMSYLTAATFTWMCNRTFTFLDKSPNLLVQWLRFLAANAVGGAVNYAVYAILVLRIAAFGTHPTLAVGVGSLAGLGVNFMLSKRYVFRRPASVEAG